MLGWDLVSDTAWTRSGLLIEEEGETGHERAICSLLCPQITEATYASSYREQRRSDMCRCVAVNAISRMSDGWHVYLVVVRLAYFRIPSTRIVTQKILSSTAGMTTDVTISVITATSYSKAGSEGKLGGEKHGLGLRCERGSTKRGLQLSPIMPEVHGWTRA